MKIIEVFYRFADWYFNRFVEPRMYWIKQIQNYRFTFLGWTFFLFYRIFVDYIVPVVWFFTARLICIFKGCDIVQTIIDDNILYEEECKRCGNIVNYTVKSKDTLIRK